MLGDILIAIGAGLFVGGFIWLAYEIATAPTIDEVFPIEDRPTTRGGENRAMPVQPGHLPENSEIHFHASPSITETQRDHV